MYRAIKDDTILNGFSVLILDLILNISLTRGSGEISFYFIRALFGSPKALAHNQSSQELLSPLLIK